MDGQHEPLNSKKVGVRQTTERRGLLDKDWQVSNAAFESTGLLLGDSRHLYGQYPSYWQENVDFTNQFCRYSLRPGPVRTFVLHHHSLCSFTGLLTGIDLPEFCRVTDCTLFGSLNPSGSLVVLVENYRSRM